MMIESSEHHTSCSTSFETLTLPKLSSVIPASDGPAVAPFPVTEPMQPFSPAPDPIIPLPLPASPAPLAPPAEPEEPRPIPRTPAPNTDPEKEGDLPCPGPCTY